MARLLAGAAGGAQKRRRRNEAAAVRARLCRAAVRCPSASLPRSAAHLLPERSEPPERTEDGASELLDVLGEERGTSGEGMEGMIVRLKRKGVGGGCGGNQHVH